MTSSSILGQTTKLEMAHVLFMDIVCYSKLPTDHQKAVLDTLKAVVCATPEFLQAEASKEMIRLPTGDGMVIVFFGDAEAAARCAMEIGRALKSHPEIPLRMGLHTGSVYRVADINANQNVAGGGINIAQRVMDCGDAGHILASQSVADVLGELSRWKDHLHDSGETDVKHGVRVHLYNVYTAEVGNAELPQKLQTAQRRMAEIRAKARRKKLALGMVAAAIAALAIGGLLYPRHAHALNERDTIVLADFANNTGDPVFDDTLKTALTVSLRQSPFLNVLSDSQIARTLQLMARSANTKLTQEVARELCQRAGSKAFLAGSIGSLGSKYVLGLKALNCQSGDMLAEEQVTAASKEKVLDTLGGASSKLRGELGESLATVRKLDVPLEQATTSSLEALQAYSRGRTTKDLKGDSVAVPLFERAIQLDPKFAMAYALLGTSYSNLGEVERAREMFRSAYELRERVSEREKFYIESYYYDLGAGDLEKARQTYELWVQVYPRDPVPVAALGLIYGYLGLNEKSLEQAREALRLDPGSGLRYANLAQTYLRLGRTEEGRATAHEARAKNLDSPYLRFYSYQLAFLQNDAAGMVQQVDWAAGKPGVEDVLLSAEAETAAYFGQLAKARGYSRQAIVSANRAVEKETAASYEADSALWAAIFGNAGEARQRAAAALALSTGRGVKIGVALALAFAGDVGPAQTLAEDLAKDFPEDTVLKFNYLPVINAQLALIRHDPSTAIEVLEIAAPFELGQPGDSSITPSLYPVYVRGEAFLAAHQGSEAAAEFQKILDHRGVVVNESIGALAHLQIGRAHAIQGDTAKAKVAYQDFLTLWKDADSDIPILKEAKAEHAKLK